MANLLTSFRKSVLAQNTLWMFLGQGMRIFVQAVYFVVIARMLGPSEYGSFGAVLALAAILSPFSSLGFGYIVIKNVVYDPASFRASWGNTLLVTLTTGAAMVGLMIGIAHFALPLSTPLALILSVGVADVMGLRLTDVAAQCFQAHERLAYTAFITLLPSVLRTIFAIYMHLHQPAATALQWGYSYMNAMIIAVIVAILLVCFLLGFPRLKLREIPHTIAEGIFFSVGLSSQTIYNDIDKTMLARYSTLDAAGIYITAYRIIDMSFVPVRSLVLASYARFFHHGKGGLSSSYAYARRLLPKVMFYAAGVGVFLFVVAPIIPRILGEDYARSVEALRWLAVLPLFKSIHYFISQSLTGAGLQGRRAAVQFGIALLNIAANLWAIPRYSWRGAAWISIACDGCLVIALYLTMLLSPQNNQVDMQKTASV